MPDQTVYYDSIKLRKPKKEDFIKYVATIEGCIALIKLGKIDKSNSTL